MPDLTGHLNLLAEEEEVGGPGEGDTVGVSDRLERCVLYQAVFADVADDFEAGILYGAVVFNVAERPERGILDHSVVPQEADGFERGILDHSVGPDMTEDFERAVLDRPVVFDVGDGLESGIRDTLSPRLRGNSQQANGQDYQQQAFHRIKNYHFRKYTFFIEITWYLGLLLE